MPSVQLNGKGVRERVRSSNLVAEAVEHGDLATVADCLKGGADANAPNQDNQTPLMLAVIAGRLDMVEKLLEFRPEMDRHCNSGETALIFAAKLGYYEIAGALLKAGADPNARGDPSIIVGHATALMHAVSEKHADIAKLLIDKGAEVNATTNNWETALMFAVWAEFKGGVELLIDAGAEKARVNVRGDTAWDIANKHKSREFANSVRGLLDPSGTAEREKLLRAEQKIESRGSKLLNSINESLSAINEEL